MTKGWAAGLKGLAIAATLAFAGTSMAQEAAPAAVAPAVAAAPAAVVAPVVAPVVADAAATHAAAQSDALAGYSRMAPTPGIGQPVPRGIAIQEQFTPIGQEAQVLLENILNPIIGVISVFVLGLLLWVVFRYRSAAVETPSTTTHNFTIEVIWTLVPALILLFIAFPSFKLLANQYSPPKADVTVKVTGYQWYWGYEYPDYGGISFDSVPLSKEEAEKAGEPYLLEVDNRLVVPAGKTVKVLVTAADVLHSFAIPSFWVKMDAVPGRINETWFKVDRPGVYYGQCSELCGTKHGFMPIAIEVLSEEDFKRWVRLKQQQDGIEPTGPGIAAEQVALTPAAVAGAVRAAVAPAPAITTEAPAAAPAAEPAA
ncbi:cytochrome c oxidase subunit II [Sandaracinobacter sp. RS1-74]|uniref:cytochrome c oxidase subunit II n=1 Tax=Sandaracinobacteroides sayramensis TaxID=2913411 RepID=UPI001EDB878E|nr:cytochrome c oxidase subunit II [Sandaracinobacteroides sayramensis]MCG2842762.1 cytochrome c oxidase subunit II [Sandaracinobacteroides sayramensis]